jgi:LSD1 subclass zinc finger protein
MTYLFQKGEKMEVYGQPIKGFRGIDMYKTSKKSFSLKIAIAEALKNTGTEEVQPILEKSFSKLIETVDISWLPAASAIYDISPDIKDYIIPVVPIITSDIPNRNSQAMPTEELFAFNPETGRLVYTSFTGKPTFWNHNNKDIKQAKGVNLDAIITNVPRYNIYKLLILSGFDRSKDMGIYNSIARGEGVAYSMGAMAKHFRCSLCNAVVELVDCKCFRKFGKGGITSEGKLVYQNLEGIDFFENSLLEKDPADWTAVTTELLYP